MKITLVSLIVVLATYVVCKGQNVNTQKVVRESDSVSVKQEFQNMPMSEPLSPDVFSMGFGSGLDFGGIAGVNLMVYAHKNVGLFAGLGYALAGAGYNAGIKVRLISETVSSRINPFALAMYGYNTVFVVDNASDLNKFFYGPTIGFGFDLRPNLQKKGYFSFAILVPIRGQEVDDYMEFLKQGGVEFKNGLPAIGLSLGYRVVFE